MKEQLANKRPPKRSSALLLASLSLLSVLGCAQIIGLDEYTVAQGGGAGVATGGGAGTSGGSANEGGEAGSSDAGSNGEAGSSGAAGGASVPQILGCDGKTAFEPNEQVMRSCILRAGCDPSFSPVRTISTCVTYNTQAALPGESCNLTSTSCADFEDCEHVGVAQADLCGIGKATRCQGDLAINCGNYPGNDRFFDCAALGGTCGTLEFQDVLFADCKVDVAPDSCAGQPTTDKKNFCHSGDADTPDLRYYCWDGQAFGASCSSFASCIDTPASSSADPAEVGNAQCFFDTDTCKGADSVSCEGDVATVCSSGSKYQYNCGAVGLACDITDDVEYCFAPGCKPADELNCKERCSSDGSKLTFCYGSAPHTVTCGDYGFTHCESDTDDNGRPFAACRF